MKERICKISIARKRANGITLSVELHPLIEEYFRSRSGGTTTGYTGAFHPVEGTLRLYDCTEIAIGVNDTLQGYGVTGKRSYLMDGGVMNMSFLRIPGASQPGGVSVRVDGVYPLNMCESYVKTTKELVLAFWRDHLSQFSFSTSVFIETHNSQEC